MYCLSNISTDAFVTAPPSPSVIVYGTVIVSPFLVIFPFAAIVVLSSMSVSLYSAPVSPAVPEITDEKRTEDRLMFKAGLT